MSCRRSDRIHLIGCKIGDVGKRGCERGCCWYPDSEIEANERYHYLTEYWPPEHNPPSEPFVANRSGLYYAWCRSSFRPKFICPKPTCRRSIKPTYDPDQREYSIDEHQNWYIRPLPSRCPGLAAAIRTSLQLGVRDNPETREIWARYFEDSNSISGDELAMLKAEDPNLWWTKLVSSGRPQNGIPASHNIRCPSCGDRAVRVGSTFEVPPRKDDRAWRTVEQLIESGEDMVAKFSSCATVEEHEHMIEEALRLRARKKTAKAWNDEKRRRIAALGLPTQN